MDSRTGEAKLQRRTIGYYPDKKSAMMALAEYNRSPAAIGTAKITFADVFELWKAEHYKKISASSADGWENAYKHSAPLHAMKMKDIRTADMALVMDKLTVGAGRQRIIKSLWTQLFDYAIKNDIVQKNYASFVNAKDVMPDTKRKPFEDDEVVRLWQHAGKTPGADEALIMIYTGMRPSELLQIKAENVDLENRLMIGGIKTKAGKDRYIPICKRIMPLVERHMADGGETLICRGGNSLTYQQFKYGVWDKMKDVVGVERTPHECRHTGITLMRRFGIDKDLVKLIVGHATGDVTDRYTHNKPLELVEAVDRLNDYPGAMDGVRNV